MAETGTVFLVAGIIGFGPAIAVLYHALRTYDYPFTEKAFFNSSRVFFALAVGMVLGTISGWISVGLRAPVSAPATILLVFVLIALFEEGFKLAYLNRKGYRGRFDTTFCGLSLGIGVAALVAAGLAYYNGPNLFLANISGLLFVYSVSLAFVHASTGAILGSACAHGGIPVAIIQAVAARVLHMAMLFPFIVWPALPLPREDVVIPLLSLIAATVFTAILYLHVYRHILPETLPVELRRQRRRRVRKSKA